MTKNFNTQIIAYSTPNGKNENHSHFCNRCNSTNLKSGAGRKPGEKSEKCGDCGKFLGYSPVARLKRAIKRKKLTESLEILDNRGITGEYEQLFLLSEIGAIGRGEA